MKKGKTNSNKVMPVTQGKGGENVVKVTNNLLIPVAIIEALVAAGVCALNYVLRYEPQIREDCSMVNWEGVKLWCTDIPWLAKPVYDSTNSTTNSVTFELPEWVFFTCAVVAPLSIVIFVEILRGFVAPKKLKAVLTAGVNLKPVFRRIPRYICTFMMGGAVVGGLVSVLKLLIVSPRPHFLEVCNPNSTLSDSCTGGFIWSPAVCEGNPIEVHEALRAFPSYHASLAVYCGVWTIVYLSTAAGIPGVYSPTLVVIGAVLVLTSIGTSHYFFTAQSSSIDLLVGGIMGAIAALYVTLVTLNGFKERQFKVKIVKMPPLGNDEHPNILPIVPLYGADPTLDKREDRFMTDRVYNIRNGNENDDDSDMEEYDFMAITSESFPYFPRATSNHHSKNSPPNRTPAQAVNSGINSNAPPPPPPLQTQPTSLGPPPSYTRNEPMSAYNVPRQRYSAPTRPPQAPDYDGARSNVLNAFYSGDSDTLPRARTENSSYF